MSNTPSSLNLASAGTGGPDGEAHEPPTIQEQDNIQFPVSDADSEILDEWKSGLDIWNRLDARKNDFTEEDRGKAWKVVDEAVKTYSDEMVRRWIAEMDTLLVYAGLFSAVLTAFNVESYSQLSPTAPDPVLAALTHISAQLANSSIHDAFINSTQPAFQPSSVSSNSASPQRWAVWLNILWFSSLVCSLSAAFVAMMVKQWIHEYNSGISGSSRNTARLRQHRYNGLVTWKVATIIAVLPVLLQIASGLFLAGLLVLLWNLHRTVAIVASALVGALLVFTLVTIILPTFTTNCAYLSPLSISMFRSFHLPYSHIRGLIYKSLPSEYSWASSDSTLKRIRGRLRKTCEGSHPRSVHAMQSAYVTSNPPKLDQDIFVTAYSTTGDLGLLDYASTCFSDHSPDDLGKFVTRIHAQNMEYGKTTDGSHWTHSIPVDMASDILLVQSCNTLEAFGEMSSQHILNLEQATKYYIHRSRAVSGGHRINCALSNMAAALYNTTADNRYPDLIVVDCCLHALRKQLTAVKEAKSALTDDVRRLVIAATFGVFRTSRLCRNWPGRQKCLDILVLCSSPASISRSQLCDAADEDNRRKPLADAIALADDALITTLRSTEFQHKDSECKCLIVQFFIDYYQRLRLEQLASRVSDRVLRTLRGAVKDLPLSSWNKWEGLNPREIRKDDLLEWLESLEKERDKQPMAADKDERTGTSSKVA